MNLIEKGKKNQRRRKKQTEPAGPEATKVGDKNSTMTRSRKAKIQENPLVPPKLENGVTPTPTHPMTFSGATGYMPHFHSAPPSPQSPATHSPFKNPVVPPSPRPIPNPLTLSGNPTIPPAPSSVFGAMPPSAMTLMLGQPTLSSSPQLLTKPSPYISSSIPPPIPPPSPLLHSIPPPIPPPIIHGKIPQNVTPVQMGNIQVFNGTNSVALNSIGNANRNMFLHIPGNTTLSGTLPISATNIPVNLASDKKRVYGTRSQSKSKGRVCVKNVNFLKEKTAKKKKKVQRHQPHHFHQKTHLPRF